MNEANRFYQPDRYEFPDDALLRLTPDQLRQVISDNMANATYHIDGLDGMTPVMVDYAQDQIEQARDLLLDQGVTFSEDEVADLPFLTWPLTEAEKAAQEQQRILDQIERERLYALRKEQERIALAVVDDAIAGKVGSNAPQLRGITLRLSDRWVRSEELGPSGADVLSLIEQLHTLGESSARLASYSCTKAGYTFETDPCPSYSVEIDLPTRPIIWLFLWSWYDRYKIRSWPTVEYAFLDGDQPSSGWTYLNEQWPELKDPTLAALDELTALSENSSWSL